MRRPVAKRVRWTWVLPLTALAVTVSLSIVGKAQTERTLAENEHVWDYLAPAEAILHSINYPAAVTAGLATHRLSAATLKSLAVLGVELQIESYIGSR